MPAGASARLGGFGVGAFQTDKLTQRLHLFGRGQPTSARPDGFIGDQRTKTGSDEATDLQALTFPEPAYEPVSAFMNS